MPQCYRTEREFFRHRGVPNDLGRDLLKTETTISRQYVQHSRSICPRFTGNVTKRKPAPAYIYDLTQYWKPVGQPGKAAAVDFDSVVLPIFNQLFFVSWSCRSFHF
jgi:hypothetical protein